MGYLDDEDDLKRRVPALAGVYDALAPDPRADYGTILPFARDQVTGDRRLAMPSILRDSLLGAVDLAAATQTGTVSDRGLGTLLGVSSLAGGLLSRPGALAAGGGRRAPFRVPETVRPDLDVPPPGIGHNMPPVTTKPYLNPDGSAIQGAPFSKASKAALAEVEARGPGAGPLDLSGNQRIPGILQEPIPRYDPTVGRGRGVPQHMVDALGNPAVIAAVDAAIDRGVGLGADKWYHNRALYDAFTKELGEEEGHKAFQKYMDYQSAASPGSDVPTNIRNASYYYVNPREKTEFTGSKNEYPYGHKMQVLHRKNADLMKADQGDWGGYTDLKTTPKPPSYGTNLGGNYTPVAGDTHAMRLVVMNTKDPRFLMGAYDEMSPTNPWAKGADFSKMSPEDQATATKALKWGDLVMDPKDPTKPLLKDGKYKIRYNAQKLFADGRMTMDEALQSPTMWRNKPTENEYAALEQFYAERGKAKGLLPAEAQSSAWAGGGEQTGLGTPSNRTFGQMHNERVLYTALMRGEDPQETLRALIRRERPLLTLPAAVYRQGCSPHQGSRSR